MQQQIKPIAFYRFERALKPDGIPTQEKYLLREKTGESALLFGMVKKGADINKEYVYLSATLNQKAGGRQWDYALYTSHAEPVSKKHLQDGNDTAQKARITGVNFHAGDAGRAWGDTNTPYIEGNHALLIELSPDLQTLTIAVFQDMAAQVQSLFQSWAAGELSFVVDNAPLPEGRQA